jgi:hypothetical protein
MAAAEEKGDENTLAWDGNSERMLFSVVTLLFALFAKKKKLVIFRHFRKIAKSDY